MNTTDPHKKLKQTRVVFFINLPLAVFALSIFINSIDKGVLWKMIASGLGCAYFLTILILLLVQMLRLQKVQEV